MNIIKEFQKTLAIRYYRRFFAVLASVFTSRQRIHTPNKQHYLILGTYVKYYCGNALLILIQAMSYSYLLAKKTTILVVFLVTYIVFPYQVFAQEQQITEQITSDQELSEEQTNTEQIQIDENNPRERKQIPAASQLTGFVNIYFDESNPRRNVFLSTFSSLLLPGSGQVMNEQYGKAGLHLLVFGASLSLRDQINVDNAERKSVEQRNDRYIYVSEERAMRDVYNALVFNTRLYSAFDAYRVASKQLERNEDKVSISDESLTSLALAPFTPRYVIEPLVFLPVFALGTYYAGRFTSHQNKSDVYEFRLYGISRDSAMSFAATRFEATGVGEEVFFRGVLNTELIRNFGVYPGIFLSSVIFGFSHNGDELTSDALTATTYGLYLGYLHHHFNYQLGYNVALHFWWNTVIYAGVLSRSDRDVDVTLPVAYFSF